jgi:ADP-ribose pyrophosphatase
VSNADVVALVVESDERAGGGGFLEIRRMWLRNRRRDGSLSERYISDSIARPYGQDAVVVCVYARGERTRILVRDGLRPAVFFGRDPAKAPLPEGAVQPMLTELVAGIIEAEDHGEQGLRVRAAAETLEEAGFVVDPARVELLGAGMYPSPGAMVEKFFFVAVEVDPAKQLALAGDGSPMEDGATTRWLELDDAIAACVHGEITDLKTELGLRRLRDHLR